MKKFSKLFEGRPRREQPRAEHAQYFTEKDIQAVNDIIADINENDDYVVYIEEYKRPGGIEKLEINLNSKDDSQQQDYFEKLSQITEDIQNVISQLKSLGQVFHRIEIIQENKYFGGFYSEIFFKAKINLTI
jgi:ABC-type phosphate transport system auxiliary subunit